MSIHILPPQLANQIAAGEVVERPSSVVKELVENALDAGADRIEIELQRGGNQLIRIRDNGCGIAKEELALALSRHATSKITSLADLEAILSLGFRGEALASISSVAKLSLTSRTASQSEAWQACAQGREMAVTVKPAAHPQGTTVEVAELFFNTPARRRFLKSEKTEYAHIDELVKRLALSYYQCHFILKHNGKVTRNLRPALEPAVREKRLTAVVGSGFVRQAVHVESEHQGIALRGWIWLPAPGVVCTDPQYCYVNGRVIRDKLVTHAIRQAYEGLLGDGQQPAYVLYLQVDPGEVDVNVHPAKHEVRFHQARLVHDFVVQVVNEGLIEGLRETVASGQHQPEPQSERVRRELDMTAEVAAERSVESAPRYPGQLPRADLYAAERGHGYRAVSAASASQAEPSAAELAGYRRLLQSVSDTARQAQVETAAVVESPLGRPLWQPRPDLLLTCGQQKLWLLSLTRAKRLYVARRLMQGWHQPVDPQPLLMPLQLKVPGEWLEQLPRVQGTLDRLGIVLAGRDKTHLLIQKVPPVLRDSPLSGLIPALLQQLLEWSVAPDETQLDGLFLQLARWAVAGPVALSWEDALALLNALLALGVDLQQQRPHLMEEVALTAAMTRLENDA